MSHPDPNSPAKALLPLAPGSRPATPTTPQQASRPRTGMPIPVLITHPRHASLTSEVGLSPGNSPPYSPLAIYGSHISPVTSRPRRSSSLSRQLDSAFEDPSVYEVAISRPSSPSTLPTNPHLARQITEANALGRTVSPQAISFLQNVMMRNRPLPENHHITTSHPSQATQPTPQVQQQRDQVPSSGSAPLYYFMSLLDQGRINSKVDELCSYLDPAKKEQRTLVFRLATQVSQSSRGQKLTVVLARWILSCGENDKLVTDLLSSHLNQVDDHPFADLMMDVDELEELMDIQFLLEDVRKLLEPTSTEEEKKESRARILSSDSWASLTK
ncbi:hypothetical protein M434DRAFT_374702 [Hypoxylon sp. CO27-5]|nr:hypothetical protein M434DRAFT_374702 [Hypoxylon sp. CO27-5]